MTRLRHCWRSYWRGFFRFLFGEPSAPRPTDDDILAARRRRAMALVNADIERRREAYRR